MPHRAAEPLVAAASIIMALHTIVSRNVDPLHTTVVRVGALHSGIATNVMRATATMDLSVRALGPGVRLLVEERIKALINLQAESLGVRADIDWRKGYCVLVNHAKETAQPQL